MRAASPEGPEGRLSAASGANAEASAAEARRAREECAAADRALASLVEDLNAKEDQLEQLVSDVAKYKQAMTEMGSTRSALYREHVRAKAGWAAERAALRERARRSESEAEANRVEANDAQTLVERLKPGAESGLKEALAAAHSRLSVLQVREVRLGKALESAVAPRRRDRERRRMHSSWTCGRCPGAAQERLAFHERRAAEAELRAVRCQRELDLCVPRAEHAALAESNRSLQTRFKELLETKTDSLVTASQLAAAKEDATTARAEAEASTAASQAAQRRVRELVKALEGVQRDAAETGADGEAEAAGVELRRELAEARADLDAAKRAAELTQRETMRLEEAKSDLERTVAGLEEQLAEAKKTLHESREAERGASPSWRRASRSKSIARRWTRCSTPRMRLRGFARRSFAPRTARRRRRRSCRRRAPGTRRARLSCRNFARAFARWNDEATPPPRLRAPTRRWCDSREARRSSSTTCRWRRRRRIVCTRIVCVCTAVCRCRMGGCSASGKIPGRSRRRRTRRCPEWKPRSPVASTSRTPRSGSARSPNSRRARNVARRSWRRRTRRFATPPSRRVTETHRAARRRRLLDDDDADAKLREIRRLGEELLQAKLAARSARAASRSSFTRRTRVHRRGPRDAPGQD